MYKNGGGVELDVIGFAYKKFCNENSISLSDHAAATAWFSYIKQIPLSEIHNRWQ